jgi:Flp pilus assembly protein TadD
MPVPFLAVCASLVAGSVRQEVTYSEHVAPIVYRSCLPCHREGESAPFELLTHAEVAKRARQVGEVTRSGYMPPWLPAEDVGAWADDRRLSDDELSTLQRWIEAGAPEGDPARLPPAPPAIEGWQLGEPDLVLEMTETFRVPAEGTDLFRNFVLPIPVERARFVEAVELRPGNKRVVHHAVLKVDRTNSSRRADAEDAEPGFPGMEMALAESPGGQFLGWTPGRVPRRAGEGMSWTLEPGSDLVVQLHLVPTGKEEPIQVRVGLHFTSVPPSRRLMVLRLRDDDIDIPPGAREHVLADEIVLPVPVELTMLYPHVHWLGKRIEVRAELPDGERKELLLIEDWDFNWQDEYRCARPVPLPAGARLVMRYTLDNSGDNPRNPNSPPVRVRAGNRSADEMATLTVQLLTANAEDRKALSEAVARHRVERYPRSWAARLNLGAVLAEQGEFEEAALHLGEGLVLEPSNVELHMNLGAVLASQGRFPEAVVQLETALSASPGNTHVLANLAQLESMRGHFTEAAAHYRAVLAASPREARAQRGLAGTLVRLERYEEAAQAYEQALALDPQDFQSHYQLGKLAFRAQRLEDATRHFLAGLELMPMAEAHQDLARVYQARGMLAEAERQRAEAQRLGAKRPR